MVVLTLKGRAEPQWFYTLELGLPLLPILGSKTATKSIYIKWKIIDA